MSIDASVVFWHPDRPAERQYWYCDRYFNLQPLQRLFGWEFCLAHDRQYVDMDGRACDQFVESLAGPQDVLAEPFTAAEFRSFALRGAQLWADFGEDDHDRSRSGWGRKAAEIARLHPDHVFVLGDWYQPEGRQYFLPGTEPRLPDIDVDRPAFDPAVVKELIKALSGDLGYSKLCSVKAESLGALKEKIG